MTKLLLSILMILSLAIPVDATEIVPPEVPESGLDRMPQNTDSFPEALSELLQNSIKLFRPELEAAAHATTGILFAAILFSVLAIFAEKAGRVVSITGALTIASMMFQNTSTMIDYASDTVWEICEYGKLLFPVLTAALAAQGGATMSATLYMGTTAFITLLGTLITRVIIPMVYLFLAFSVAYCALGEEVMKKFADAIKGVLSWSLKTLMIVFTTYMSITGVVSGTTDAAALKAAKVTISSVVPVVGGILSDASESVLVGMGIMKNAAGIYGILAVFAVFMGPFLKVGVQYLMLKISAAVCGIFGNKNISALVGDFSAAMGLLLAMVAASCMLVLIGTVCYLKGIG